MTASCHGGLPWTMKMLLLMKKSFKMRWRKRESTGKKGKVARSAGGSEVVCYDVQNLKLSWASSQEHVKQGQDKEKKGKILKKTEWSLEVLKDKHISTKKRADTI